MYVHTYVCTQYSQCSLKQNVDNVLNRSFQKLIHDIVMYVVVVCSEELTKAKYERVIYCM